MTNQFCSELRQKLPPLLLNKLPDIKLIYLFGSHASGLATKSSDIDVAVMAQGKLEPISRWKIAGELASELSSEVDLIDLLSASTVMQNQIIHQGIRIFGSEKDAIFFEMQVVSMYQHLNEERAEILKQHMSR